MRKSSALHLFGGLVLLVALAMRVASTPSANLSYLLIAGYALLGRAQAIQALAASWLFSMLSLGVAPEATASSIGRYVVLASACVSALVHSNAMPGRGGIRWPVLATLLLGLFLIGHSMLFSPVKDVSVLKAVSWTTAATTLISAWAGLALEEQTLLIKQIFFGFVAIMVASLPLLAMPAGYLTNGTGFQGIMSQPQAFGPSMALLSVLAFCSVLEQRESPWWLLGVAGISLVLVILSEARTGGMALALGLTASVVTFAVVRRRSLGALLPGLRSYRVHLVVFLSLSLALFAAPLLKAVVGDFLAKGTQSSSLTEVYEASRGGLMRKMWDNVEAHPLTGIGFGIASYPEEMIVDRDPFLDLPIGGAIEKGVLPIAVLEEVGGFGFMLVALWISMLLRRAAKLSLSALGVVFTALLLNMGEYTFFSPGGLGMIALIFFGWAAAGRVPRANGV